MHLLMYLLIGAIVGSITSQISQINSWLGWLVDLIEGMVGAFLAGYFISPLLKLGRINDAVTISSLRVALVGSIAMIWIVKVVHHQDTNDRPVLDSGQTNRQRGKTGLADLLSPTWTRGGRY